jgi:hypothetical protein
MSSFAFPKTRRLTRRLEYERVKRDGSMQRGKLLMLNVVPMENLDLWRAGLLLQAASERGRSQSGSASFTRDCSQAATSTPTRLLVRDYCQARSGDRQLWSAGR